MNKNFWNELAAQGPIVALAPMDGYCDSAFRQVNKTIAPNMIPFSEFYSADGLVHSKDLAKRVLPHADIEKPLIIQIFGKDPEKFRQAAILIESYGVSGIDINMGCPAKKVVKSGHGSSLMINRDTAFKIVEEMAKAVKIPISVKTRLGWENHDLLVEFCKGLENAGANLITVHGRTYKQAFTGKADFTGIYNLKQHLNIPVIANGDVMDYDDGAKKIIHPSNRNQIIYPDDTPLLGLGGSMKNLDGFMIGRASFGNPWCFLPGSYCPTLEEILVTMELHARLLIDTKGPKGALEIRKHLVQYLRGFPGVKLYRTRLVHTETLDDVFGVTADIRREHANLLTMPLEKSTEAAFTEAWDQCNG
ncbi:MAG: tRNA-dihydrouridine synthase family protein [Candidatus Gracilibacteria bacterium]|nr:tRNA-dihydrouridine synthase family protein [Candidatus Gracilibacteria bacterium]